MKFFVYLFWVIKMKIYLDLVMILNFFFDFILLLSVSILLRRNVSIYKLILGSFIGGLSILFLFINVNSLQLFLYKIIISILMTIISFGYKNLKYTFKNLLYLYSASIILGGFLYFLNNEFSLKQEGLVFVNNGLSINVIFLIIFCPIIIYIYIKQGLWLKNNYSNYYKVDIYFNDNKYTFNAFLDTGNNLTVPIINKPIILIDKKINSDYFFYVPYKGVNNSGLLKCIKVDKIEINGLLRNKVVVGLLDEKIKIDGIDCLLNKKLLEE